MVFTFPNYDRVYININCNACISFGFGRSVTITEKNFKNRTIIKSMNHIQLMFAKSFVSPYFTRVVIIKIWNFRIQISGATCTISMFNVNVLISIERSFRPVLDCRQAHFCYVGSYSKRVLCWACH